MSFFGLFSGTRFVAIVYLIVNAFRAWISYYPKISPNNEQHLYALELFSTAEIAR